MSNQKTIIDEKAAVLGDAVKNQFAKVGEEAKQHLLTTLKGVLENDINSMKNIVEQTILSSSQQIKDQLHTALTAAITQQLGGSIFGIILHDLILPTVFHGISSGKLDLHSQSFKEAASQTMLDIGNSIAKSNARNG
jgi:hypothetical protein